MINLQWNQESMAIDDVLERQLRQRKTGDDEWRVWEYKTLNIHRGVLHWQPRHPPASFRAMIDSIHEKSTASFRVGWWRGFGFGAIIESPTIPKDIALIDSVIDVRARNQGTWQWTAFACTTAQIAVGVHTWKEGYLSQTYRGWLAYYESLGWQVGSFKKEKDKLMQFITTIARLKGVNFTEFQP